MEKRSLKNKLNGRFLDSMNYIQSEGIKYRKKVSSADGISKFYDNIEKILPDKDSLEESFNYFLDENNKDKNSVYALALLLDYSSNRRPEIDHFDYIVKVVKKKTALGVKDNE